MVTTATRYVGLRGSSLKGTLHIATAPDVFPPPPPPRIRLPKLSKNFYPRAC